MVHAASFLALLPVALALPQEKRQLAEDPTAATSFEEPTFTSSAPTTTRTATPFDICIAKYISKPGDNCATVDARFNLVSGTTRILNSFVSCDDVWAGTPLCIPDGPYAGPQPPQPSTHTCQYWYKSGPGDNCETIETMYDRWSGTVYSANTFLNCNDVFVGTDICVPAGGNKSGYPDLVGNLPGEFRTYTSRAGDTCTSVELHLGNEEGHIPWANRSIDCAATIPEGTALWYFQVLAPVSGTCVHYIQSKAGDTCASIAKELKHPHPGHLVSWNQFLTCDDIWVGTNVCVSHTL